MTTPALVPAAAGQHPAFTPIAFVRCVAQAYAQRGMEVGLALQQAQIAPALLADDQARITALQMELLCAHAMRELDDEGLGWFQRRLPWAATACWRAPASAAPRWGWPWRAGAATTAC